MRQVVSHSCERRAQFSRMSMHVGASLFFDNADLTPRTILNDPHGNRFTNKNLTHTKKLQFHRVHP